MDTAADQRTRASIRAYGEHARAYQRALRQRRPVQDVRRFASMAGEGALVLDVGCGPANDLRALMDAGLHPVGVDLAFGALREAHLLLPRTPVVQAPYDDLPFRVHVFGGLWFNGAFNHLPRDAWGDAFGRVMGYLDTGPVYFACVQGTADLRPVDHPILGRIFVSEATEAEVEKLFTAYGLREVHLELRPDPLFERKRRWVVAIGRSAA